MILFIAYPAVSLRIFKVFRCINVEGEFVEVVVVVRWVSFGCRELLGAAVMAT